MSAILLPEMFELMIVKLQVERYNLGKLLIKGTVEKIIPVTEQKEESEEENDWTEEQKAKGEAMNAKNKGDGSRRKVKYFQVQLQEGIILKAHQVVMATGPTRAQMANIPSWVKSIGESYPEERLQHTVHLMHHLAKSKQKLRETRCERQNDSFPTAGKTDFSSVLCSDFQTAGHFAFT